MTLFLSVCVVKQRHLILKERQSLYRKGRRITARHIRQLEKEQNSARLKFLLNISQAKWLLVIILMKRQAN